MADPSVSLISDGPGIAFFHGLIGAITRGNSLSEIEYETVGVRAALCRFD
jgi:hypothetical protein